MLFRTHLVFSIFLFLLLDPLVIKNKFLFFISTVVSSVVLDLDLPKSKIGKRILLSHLINLFFGHRGFLQSFTFVIIFSLTLFLLKISPVLILGFATGYSSHLLLDSLTIKGVYLFWPLKVKVKGFLRTGSLLENLLFLVFFVLVSLMTFHKLSNFL
ncbi:MAG: metal-dependent hydrolase [Candidatus Pacearchaeota archaeon]|nr:metal-dependent hydrolase [Candidatus Pacearchaeota archaeon]